MKKELNIALLGTFLIKWGGGLDLLRYIINALLIKSESIPINLYLLLPERDGFNETCINRFNSLKRVLKSFFIKNNRIYIKPTYDKNSLLKHFKDFENQIKFVFYTNSRKGLHIALKKIKADIVLPVTVSLGKSFPIPWIGYIVDFQHKYYPEFFTNKGYKRRDFLFEEIIKYSNSIIVNSETIKDDVAHFYPNFKQKVFSLPFAPSPNADLLEEIEHGLNSKYNLPKRYFIISNQFWKHKSHITAFEALAILIKNNKFADVKIVCTGKHEDYRFPNYFSSLIKQISSIGISEKIIFLGYIAKKEQIQIMRKSTAVIQPTLYEGSPGGLAVYDSVAIGVPAIISDIPINKEIHEDNIIFFKTGSSSDLAEKMKYVLSKKLTRYNNEKLIALGKKRTMNLADKVLESISFALELDFTY